MKYSNLQTRWRKEWTGNNAFRQAEAALTSVAAAAEDLAAARARAEATGTLSPKGILETVRAHASEATVPTLRRAEFTLGRLRDELAARRSNLAVPKPDPSDIAGAILRADARAVLRQMDQGARINALMNDPAEVVLIAAFEGPPFLSGLTPELAAEVEERLIGLRHGPELDEIEEIGEAIALGAAALAIAVSDLRTIAGFNEQDTGSFDKWMRTASVPVERELAARRAEPVKAVPALKPNHLPLDVPDVEVAIDAVFAEAFPALYPNHPENSGAGHA